MKFHIPCGRTGLNNRDGDLPDEESREAREILADLAPGDLTICVSFLQHSVGAVSEPTSEGEILGQLDRHISLPTGTKKRFAMILTRLVKAQEGISRREMAFIRHIWHELRGDWDQTIGSPLRGSIP